jgi:microcystin-dependent protein
MEPFLGEIRMFAFEAFINPKIWAPCNGQLLPISQNMDLFGLLGTQYGGNGQTNFALPDLQGRVPMHAWPVGQQHGSPGTMLTPDNLASHEHPFNASTAEIDTPAVTDSLLGQVTTNLYRGIANGVTMAKESISGPITPQLPVSNMQPFLGLMFCIAIKGEVPKHK